MGEEETDAGISVYPNPAGDMIYVDLEGVEENTMIQIADVHGRVVGMIHTNGGELTGVGLSAYENGTYLITIKNATVFYTKTIIKL